MQIVRLKKEHYTQLVSLLNFVFTKQNGREMDFEKELPKAFVKDDENMFKHLGIFDGEKLVAVLGEYPLKARVLDEELLFYTVGNIATHPKYQSQGYMQALIEQAMQDLEEKGADVSRLGGARQRYERFGYEPCGLSYAFTLTKGNVLRGVDFHNDITFEKITQENVSALELASNLQSSGNFFVERKKDNGYFEVYSSMTAWKNVPYLAKQRDRVLGYLCAQENGGNIAEFFAYSAQDALQMLCGWQKRVDKNITFQVQPHEIDKIRVFASVCEKVSVVSPSQFKIIRWEKVISAFMKLKASYTALPKGECRIYIEKYGGLRLFVEEKGVGCEKYAGECEIALTSLEATRYIFGTLPPETTANANELVRAWFPLPLSWNLQDRV